jgi:hypothetical protein
VKLVEVVQICYIFPSAWTAKTDTGMMLYLKYRRGVATVWREDASGSGPLNRVTYGHPLESLITLEQFCEITGLELADDVDRVDLGDPNEGFEDYIDGWYRDYIEDDA